MSGKQVAGNCHTFPLKRAKVYATRDFPPGCGDRTNENETEGFSIPVTAKRSNAANRVPFDLIATNEMANLSAVPPDAALAEKNKVTETLKLFRDVYKQLLNEYEAANRKQRACVGQQRFDVQAASLLKKRGKCIHSEKRFGHIPGVAIGDKFHFRAELAVVGLHCQYVSGIDYMMLRGKKFAVSVVNSGYYQNRAKTADVLIYSGQGGGHVGAGNKMDQKLERGNLALLYSMKEGYPVRVIRKIKDNGDFGYTYDGLYLVKRSWQERDDNRKLMFKFELHRMSGQQSLGESKRSRQKECCVVDDVSRGMENMAIRAMNGIDCEKPPSFTYTTSMIYPETCKQIQYTGCNCINGCSNLGQCVCIFKNGGEIPFNEKGAILGPKAVVYECGPSCKCPVSCMNRVSQRGPQYRLEIYKTESRGWGVRSRSYISSGSFICEYVGILQQTQNVDHGKGGSASSFSPKSRNHENNEMVFTIDASKVGNVGRFIGYSRSPNLFVQRALYDHGDERIPHIMLFAAKNIPPLQELTLDYRHQVDGKYRYRLQD